MGKTHTVIYHAILNRLQFQSRRAALGNDRLKNDIAGPNNVGMIAVLIGPGHLDRALVDGQPDHLINSLIELCRF